MLHGLVEGSSLSSKSPLGEWWDGQLGSGSIPENRLQTSSSCTSFQQRYYSRCGHTHTHLSRIGRTRRRLFSQWLLLAMDRSHRQTDLQSLQQVYHDIEVDEDEALRCNVGVYPE